MKVKEERSPNNCQIRCLPKMAEPPGTAAMLWQRRNRLRRILRRRWRYVFNLLSEVRNTEEAPLSKVSARLKTATLQPGDLVMVRSREEIKSTLDRWNQFKGCTFMEEMWQYCDTTHRVLKRVTKIPGRARLSHKEV